MSIVQALCLPAALATGALAVTLPAAGSGDAQAAGDSAPSAQTGDGPNQAPALLAPGILPEGASPEAVERWTGMVDALREPAKRDVAIDAFQIQFDLRARTGLQTNDILVETRFLQPDLLALELPSNRAIGLGPAGPWLRESDGSFVHLTGREYASDQRMLASTIALARNYLALSDPHRIRLTSLTALDEPPTGLPDVRGLRPGFLRWIEIVTPDFKVLEAEPPRREAADRDPPRRVPPRRGAGSPGDDAAPEPDAAEAEPEPLYRVAIGLDRKSLLPEVLVLRAAEPGDPSQTVEHCIRLREFRADSGLFVPWRLDVYQRWPLLPEASAFGTAPAQEIDLIRAMLSPGLAPHDFIPPPWR